MVRRGEPLSRNERGQAPSGRERVAHRSVAGSPRGAGPPPTQPTGCSAVWRSGVTRSGRLPTRTRRARGPRRDRDDRATLAAGLETRPGAVQALLRAPRDRDRCRGLIGLSCTFLRGGVGLSRVASELQRHGVVATFALDRFQPDCVSKLRTPPTAPAQPRRRRRTSPAPGPSHRHAPAADMAGRADRRVDLEWSRAVSRSRPRTRPRHGNRLSR